MLLFLFAHFVSFAQPRLVKDINPGPTPSASGFCINLNGLLIFSADDGLSGTELWKSDGTESGTVMVADVVPGQGNSFPANITVMGNQLFFTTNDGTHGVELWVTDGTEGGTGLLKDIAQGNFSSGPGNLRVINNVLYFNAQGEGNSGNRTEQSKELCESRILIQPGIPILMASVK